ncbi:Rpn family recombination-promoting nuclease/putative transposase [Beggiatoa leptomitoformis]|uniref:Rpn family recombination-promoting nuclease/putative transposase n=1 Tax=Beggiatoa leptomitoformis TaxID=288004 RepID=A0A2N9YFN2_9GAMM|nr:Rpn family recombination-promoting nuclease/putative transposase [Beggiatoa leptomitoformis]ALG68400.1 Rpn family recombination-promoting nuclease/putative transposase [Beggiatoa leptomitoformis]AUI69273.1 Rpn family recombination-promoting nuclease/putative transposase [Beggiatoa leptomitoformis]
MQQVASLRYGVIFKKAFCDVEVFTAFVRDFLGFTLEIDKVETEKSFDPPIGGVDSRFDLYAEDKKNRVIVDIQHRRYKDYYDRFLHYHCAALLEQISNAKSYSPALTVFTIVVLTSGTKEDCAIAEINFDPVDIETNQRLNRIHHRILYLSPKQITDKTREPCREWLLMIQDSLDEQIDESAYHKSEILKVLNLIKTDGLTPQDRARMKDEYSLEELMLKEKTEEFHVGVKVGIEKGIQLGVERQNLAIAKHLKAQGMSLEMIAQITGLTHEQLNNSE